ncbi:MAG TPA: hypothetical protein VE422_50500 [Terriglobia bacterium]|nr:hypothetical protein [Terriglobia bacterium]
MSTTVQTTAGSSAHRKRLVLMLWILVAIFYFYLSYDYIRVTMNDKKFGDYVQYVVQVAGAQNRPNKEIRALILVRADELRIPIKGEDITILGGGETLNVRLNYQVDIEIPLFEKAIYSKEFPHRAEYQRPR